MASNTSFEYGRKLATCEDGDEVVISGISGTYPSCENITELAEALFQGKDLITDIPELKFSVGRIKNVSKFDAQFFGITHEHAEYMDPMCRILLEKTYEAIADSGYNINHFRGTTVAVYVANCTSDAEVESTHRTDIKGALICERAQSFLANRISYWLGINGPSCTVNTACSSSLYALELAYKAIRNGECEAALVGGSNLSRAPGMVNLYVNLGITSARCRSFDNSAKGFCRSEAISVVLLQKSKHARRMYAQVVHVKTNNDGYKKQTILFPSATMQKKLINEVFEESNTVKSKLSWVEAHGTGTRVGDYQEMVSLETLCQDRSSVLLCGCVKSNLGHTEATSGLCSIAKVIIAMEMGIIPPNINFQQPQKGIKVLQENKIKIVTESTPWSGGLVAINNFGIGGSNAHLLLKSNTKEQKAPPQPDKLYLVNVSGRTSESIKFIFDYLNSTPLNSELINLLHRIHSEEIANHPYRGYAILGQNLSTRIDHQQRVKPGKSPIWFIYPGMGSQGAGMAKELLKLDIFKKSIQECAAILTPKNINLMEILTSDDEALLKNILYCFVGITAMMISLTDLLEAIGIRCSGLIGHSFGEIGCAYADKCLTKEEALKVAYYRGVTSLEMKTIHGSMAVVGLSSENMLLRCPSTIEIACKNGTQSCTIAGPSDIVKEFVKGLKSEGIFVAEIYSANIAYHSRYIRLGGPIYHKYLKKVIKTSKERSPRWISSSIIGDEGTSIGKFCSADYFVNNFLEPVNFENALKEIPKDALTLEVSPHSILRYVLNETLDKSIANISLVNKTYPSPLQYFLGALGTLYEKNIDMDLTPLYAAVQYPVSRGTPMIAPLIKWFHDEDWHVPFENMNIESKPISEGKSFVIDCNHDKFIHLRDCIVNGVNVFPESGYLKIVWEMYAEQKTSRQNNSIIFRNVHFHKIVTIPSKGVLIFNVIITYNGGYFEVINHDEVVCSGHIDILQEDDSSQDVSNERTQDTMFILQNSDIYKEFRIKGYAYGDNFQTILRSNLEGTIGQVKWAKDWILYLDGIFQLFNFSEMNNSNTKLLQKIDFVKINISKQNEYSKKFENVITASVAQNNISSGGVIIKGIASREMKREPCKAPVLQKFQFVPYFGEKILPLKDVVRAITTVILENTLLMRMKIVEIIDPDSKVSIFSKELDDFFQIMSFFEADFVISKPSDLELDQLSSHFKVENIAHLQNETVDVLILPNLNQKIQKYISLLSKLKVGTFVISREIEGPILRIEGYEMAASYSTQNDKLLLWHRIPEFTIPAIIQLEEESFCWVENLQKILKRNPNKKIIIYSQYNSISGIIGFFKCVRREPCGRNLRCFLILDYPPLSFSMDDSFYKNQIKTDLAINVYKDGQWGCYVPLEMDPLSNVAASHVNLEISHQSENLELKWVQGELDQDPRRKDEGKNHHIRVHYATLPDGLTNKKFSQGYLEFYEFSGTTQRGNVMGLSFSDRISNFVPEHEGIYWTIPPECSLQEGLTLPLAYLTALMILTEVGKVELKTILVHNIFTRDGQAVMNLFLKYDYTVMTFVKTVAEKETLEGECPKVLCFLKGSHPNIERKAEILLLTDFDSEICDLMDLVGSRAYIFYTGDGNCIKWQNLENLVSGGRRFQAINLPKMIKKDHEKALELKNLLDKELKGGSVRPLGRIPNRISIPGSIKKTSESIELKIEGGKETFEATPKFICNDADVYIICGGLGGMGFELADWLEDRGAKKIILVSRTGNYNRYQLRKISKWQSRGIFVKISTDDISTIQGVENLLRSGSQMGTITAIFNTTLILHDGLFENLTPGDFQSVANPKSIATIYLDEISRVMCPSLKHFVVFSSIVCGYGNAGQSNYGYANAVVERICESRRSQGLPALAVEWAGVGDVGYLKNSTADKLPAGTLLQPIRSCLDTLEYYLCSCEPVVSSFVVSEKRTSVKSKYDTIFTKIKTILDKADPELPGGTTLKDIGLDSITVTETRLILEQKFNLLMNAEDILNLKLDNLWDIEKKKKISTNTRVDLSESTSIRNISILEKIYANVLEVLPLADDLTSLPPLVRLESYLHEGKTHYVGADQEPTIFFLPSIEGVAGVMLPLSRHVDLQVLCAQYNFNDFDVKEIASKLLQEIDNKLGSQTSFHILGYSFGGLIAMEIVHSLEQKGKLGHLYLIDSSPIIVKSIASSLFNNQEFYNNILGFVRALKTKIDLQQFQKDLNNFKDWESAINFTMQSLPDDLVLKKEYLKIILNSSYQRNKIIHSYKGIPKKSLKSKVLVFKPKEDIFSIPSHGLSEYCEYPIEEYVISGNHFTIMKTTELAHYIMTSYRQNSDKNTKR